jgi:hypothetical protein
VQVAGGGRRESGGFSGTCEGGGHSQELCFTPPNGNERAIVVSSWRAWPLPGEYLFATPPTTLPNPWHDDPS